MHASVGKWVAILGAFQARDSLEAAAQVACGHLICGLVVSMDMGGLNAKSNERKERMSEV